MAIEVLISMGSYSDYGIEGLFVVESQEWLDKEWRAFRDNAMIRNQAEQDKYFITRSDFSKWLLDHGATKMLQLEAHIGDYDIEATDELNWREYEK